MMRSSWTVSGRVGRVRKVNEVYVLDLAERLQDDGHSQNGVLWFNILCKFEPKVEKGDEVLVCGSFDQSKNKKFQYAMIAEIVALVRKGQQKVDAAQEE